MTYQEEYSVAVETLLKRVLARIMSGKNPDESGFSFIGGAAHYDIGNPVAGEIESIAVPARATRRAGTLRNLDGANDCVITKGAHTFPLRKGESIAIDTVEAITCKRVGDTDVPLAYIETYD